MNYLERLIDEQKQLLPQIQRAERAVVEMGRKYEEITEIIETISKLERYRSELDE